MKSIKSKLMISVSSILFLFTLASIFLNNLLLEKYYVYKAKKTFLEYYEKIDVLENEELNRNLLFFGIESGLEINVIDKNYRIIKSSKLKNKEIIGKNVGKNFEDSFRKINKEKYYYGVLEKKEETGKEIIFLGKTLNNDFVMIRKNMKELSDNAKIANMFFIIVGGFLFLVSLPLVNFLSRHFSKPIEEIGEVVESINLLDFSKKFKSKNRDEINILGENINEISEKLDKTILELKESNKKLAKEMEKQKMFFASISHEFKTPLGLIRGYCETLNLNLGDKKETVKIIVDEVNRMNILINDITDLIRFDRSDFKLNYSEFDVISLANRRILNFENRILEKGIRLEKRFAEKLLVRFDKGRFIQVFDNLMSNAINYVDVNKIIEIDLYEVESVFTMKIYNTSSPINTGELEMLFNNFYRLEKDRSRATGGSGLGLAIVKKIIIVHGGECSIKNYKEGILLELKVPLNKK